LLVVFVLVPEVRLDARGQTEATPPPAQSAVDAESNRNAYLQAALIGVIHPAGVPDHRFRPGIHGAAVAVSVSAGAYLGRFGL